MQNFSKTHRLIKADDFSSVFIFRKVKSGVYFKIHFKPNNLAHSRLGVVVSKRVHKRANRRNYMKRVIRELFRTSQSNWHGNDVIVRVTKYFCGEDFHQVQAEFARITKTLHSI